MQGDDPPYLSVGTAVSAKYKGAFCEAKVSKVVHIVKCKISYKMGLGTATVTDEHINGTLRVGQLVQAKHPDNNDYVEATIMKIQDCSQYTVVFDDGDIMTLRRTALCLKGGKHFNESETLDQLPLTHPEHFGNPVMVRGRGRRSRQLKEDSSEGEAEEENEPDLELYSVDTGKVVSVDAGDKKRNKDSWFPGLIVMPSAQPTVRINMKDEFLIRSFKDGRYYTVPKKEVNEFKREMGSRVESSTLAEAVDKAIKFLDNDELPAHWEKNSLFNLQSQFSDCDESVSDSSDDEPTEEKDHFVAQLYKFMDDSGTPLNKTPTIGNKDVDLYKLFRLVEKFGGYNRVTNQNKWKTITARLKFNQNQANYNHVKQVYKKWLLSYESFYRTLGCTMLNPTRNAKKNRGRPLIRDKDRMTPVQSPRPEKEDDTEQKKEDEEKTKTKKADSKKVEEDKKRKEAPVESSDNSSDATDQSEAPSTSKDLAKSKRTESKPPKEKKVKPTPGDKVKSLVEKFEDHSKKNADDDKIQQTRSKSQVPRSKEVTSPERKIRDTKTPNREPSQKPTKSTSKKPGEDDKDKKRGRKRNNTDDKTSNSDSSVNELSSVPPPTSTSPPSTSASSVCIGDKLKVYYGPTHESKVTYEAKVLKIEKDPNGQYVYLVHYTGWNTRYDERIAFSRIAENLSATTKAKRLKQSSSAGSKSANKTPAKRGRGMSITGRSTVPEPPRSTTPSSITSTSSRTKSPATPVSKSSANRVTRQDSNRRTRRTSAQTDISVQSESESDERSESESELTRTRSGSKDDSETKTYRRKLIKTKGDKRKDDEDTEKEEEIERPKRSRKMKKSSDVKALVDSDDEGSNQPKGREFDLNQIRSELKGFGKAIKVTSTDTSEKETVSSDESTTVPEPKDNSETETDEKKEKVVEKSSSSEDIYEFKEPEPFEFEVRKSSTEDKGKKRIPRLYDEVEKSPPKKKSPKSPAKIETKESETEKKRFRRTPVKKQEEVVEEEVEKKEVPKKSDDPFDKLVESPSFHIGKSSTTEKPLEKPSVVKALNMDESLSIFELAENLAENSEDRLDLSDNDAHSGELTFTHSTSFFQENFGKPSPDHMIDAACDSFTAKTEDIKKNVEEDTEVIDNTSKVVEQSTVTDDETSDMVLEPEPTHENKTTLSSVSISTIILNRIEAEDAIREEVVEEKKIVLPKQLAAVFQETDSSLLEDLCSTPQYTSKIDDLKDINLKTGTTIADTILQKLKSNENNSDMELEPSEEEEEEEKEEKKVELKIEPKTEPEVKEEKLIVEVEPKIEIKNEIEEKLQVEEKKPVVVQDFKKRYTRKFVSKKYIIDTDTESDSDSEQRLVIVPSDDDSQTSTSVDNKTKETESVPPGPTLTENTTCEVEERNFNFDNIKLAAKEDVIFTMDVEQEEEEKTDEIETNKDDEPDSNLHSMLFCEETIPGSPAPAPQNEPKKSKNNVLEMPFASAPSGSSSNNKNLLIQQEKAKENQPSPVSHVLPLENRENIREASAVVDNTPPTTPESTISNLSPRGEIGGLSPNNGDNESCKSTETDIEYTNSRRSAPTKVTNYSEDDSLPIEECPIISKKMREALPSPCKKRRRSCKGDSENVPTKRGRKPNRSRPNSDSDDTSEHSLQDIANSLIQPSMIIRTPRPSKYNFLLEFDPDMDSATRISLIQQTMDQVKKEYIDVKSELQVIEKRRKKLRRREREALRAAKHEACL